MSILYFGFLMPFLTILLFHRAKRNARGHLEPDAPDEVVLASQGFADYEHSPKAEDRKDAA